MKRNNKNIKNVPFLEFNHFFCHPLQVIFITEYMSSGSLKQFLKKTKKNHKTMNEKVA